MNTNFWRGEHVRLRSIEQRDLDALVSSPEEADTWLLRADDHISFPTSPEQDRNDLDARRARDGDAFFWQIENNDGVVVGNIATFDCDARVGSFKYSIVIGRPFWGRGYAREAITIVLRYYFRERRYQKCTIIVYSFNQRSIAFHQRFGFQAEGRLRRTVYTNGELYDELYFGLTCEEFDLLDPKQPLESLGPVRP